ncbi:MAG: DNA translocase FtsK [Bdellovibrionales bacterium]
MARTRTIRRNPRKSKAKSQNAPKIPFIPDRIQGFVARRCVDGMAVTFALTGMFILLSLISYDQTDPSWNTATSDTAQNIHNWMGQSGAGLGDLLVQTLGAVGFMIAGIAIMWGARIFNRQTLKPFTLRVVALIVGVIFSTIALAQIPSSGWSPQNYLGGTIGSLCLQSLSGFHQSFGLFFSPKVVSLLAAVLALPALIFAAAISKHELAIIGQFIVKSITFATVCAVNSIIGFRNWIGHYNEDYKPRPKKSVNFNLFGPIKEASARIAPRIGATQSTQIVPDFEIRDNDSISTPTAQTDRPVSAQPLSTMDKRMAIAIPVVTPEQSGGPQGKAKDTQHRFALDGEDWALPSLDLLENVPENVKTAQLDEGALRKNAELLQNVLADFNVEGEITSIHPGPVVTLYELEPAPGTKSAKVIGLADDIARSMSAVSVRVAVVPGRNVIGIELPNKTRQIVYMRELLASRLFEKTSAHLPLILGKDIGGQPILADLAKMPHLLVAGTTGSGKSVAVNTMILSLLYALSPEKCRFIMIDPKMLELSVYDDIPHLLSPVVTEPGKAVVALKWTVNEMEERYRAMSKLGVRNIEGYNARIREALKKGETILNKVQTGFDADGQPTFEDREMPLEELPYIVVVVDEFADLMLVAGKDVESAIQRLAQMARAAGIHLIMATQRPSVDVITGVIKANFPTRISFQVTSKVDSRTILGEGGAEQLLGMGDMLYMAPGGRITRVHGPFVSDSDVEKVVDDLKAKSAPAYIESITDENAIEGGEVMDAMFGGSGGGDGEKVDELYDQAVAIVAREGKASTSFVQRYLQIGYNRAARIIEEMERQGVISKANATGKREVLIHDYSDVG